MWYNLLRGGNIMYRKLIDDLIKWKNKNNRKPLILKGARQVGKTWLARYFGENYYENYAYINFDSNERIEKLFSGDYDIDRIIQGLKIESGVNIEPEKTLIIFDEIGEVPKAISSLKYFYEQAPYYHIIAAGSLLGVTLHENTSFPVGKVDFLSLYPLNFEEFLTALGEEKLTEAIKTLDLDMLTVFHDKINLYLKKYLYVGGMPEAVASFIDNQNFEEVREIQTRLLEAYENDFSKHVPNTLVPRVRAIWNSIPAQLSKENKKFIFGLIKEGARAREYENALLWLMDAGLVYKVYRTKDYKIPLSAYRDENAFKVYFLDVGLLGAKANLSSKTILEGDNIFVEFKGSLTEQFVLGELKTTSLKDIYYWSNDTGISEIDFMVENDGELIPIEVKSSYNLRSKSLKAFIQKYDSKINIRTSLTPYKKEEQLINVPLYIINNIQKVTTSSNG